ncbi:hypothetical protein [Streptomyces malaysiensis]|uniref:hypothetical protein n=1 Tax=Streptomyces malaysiensis TaxID=92644 RepID=UPI002B2C7B1C|nr:hypothetical protein R8789_00030 [Streptomyces malaysiensis]WPB96034.1 hypothetical protein R8789_46775 [Streptomyces malaysiensis]
MPNESLTQKQRRDQAEAALLNAAAELIVEQGVRSLTLARMGDCRIHVACHPLLRVQTDVAGNAWHLQRRPDSCPA